MNIEKTIVDSQLSNTFDLYQSHNKCKRTAEFV